MPLDDFVAGCLGAPGASPRALRVAERFWSLHDLADVTARWASHVPAERLHLVTVPRAGAPADLLWRRFAEATGLDPELGRTDNARPNTSLTAPEAELLRRYNADHAGDVTPRHYDRVIRAMLAERVLTAGEDRGAPLVLPVAYADAVSARADATVQTLAERGYPVVGDLADLVPDGAAMLAADTDPVDDAQVGRVAVRAVAGFVAEIGPLTRRLAARQQDGGVRVDAAADVRAEANRIVVELEAVPAAERATAGVDAIARLVRATAALREEHGVGFEPAGADGHPGRLFGRVLRRLRRGGVALTRRVRS